jgi:HK97 family phage portal protein
MTDAPLWSGVRLLTGDFGKLPCLLYRKQGKGRTLATDHPAYRLLLRQPNPIMRPSQWKKTMLLHALLHGDGWSYINRKGNGEPVELLLLNPDRTYPKLVDGRLWVLHEVEPGNMRKIPPEDILHLPGLGFDGIQGYNLVQYAKDVIGYGIGARKFGAVFLRNNARPNLALEVPGRMKEAAKINLRESWERAHSGLENQHRIALLEEGVKLQQYSINARDSQLLETREFHREEVALLLRIPPHKLGVKSSVSYNSQEQSNQEYLDEGLDPWLHALEEECWEKLLTEEEKQDDSHEFCFDRKKLLRANLQARSASNVAYVNAGIINRDEAREDEGYDPIPDGQGKVFLVSANTRPADEDPEEAGEPKQLPAPKRGKPEPDQEAIHQANRTILLDALGRMARRLTTHARRAAAEPRKFMAWLDEFTQDHLAVVTEALGPPVAAWNAARGDSWSASGVAGRILTGLRARLLDAAGEATAKELAGKVDASCSAWEAEEPQRQLALMEQPA